MGKVKNIAKYSIMITIVLALSKLVGMVREFMIAGQFGATIQSDIYKTATRIPQLFYGCVGAALTTTFIPIFSGIKDNKKEANKFFNNTLNIILVVCTILSVIGIIFSKQLTFLMVQGLDGESLETISNMTKIVMPSIIFLAISGLYTGYLQSYGKFLQPALTGIAASLVMILSIVVFGKYGLIAIIIAFLLSSVAQTLIQRPFMGDYKYEFFIDIKDKNLRKMLMLSIPILISTAVGQINIMVSSTYASFLAKGSISIVDYTGKVSSLINQVFIISITTVFYPMLTEKFSRNDKAGFNEMFVRAMNIIIIIVMPLILGLFVLSKPTVKLMLQQGKFTEEKTQIASTYLKYLVFSTFGYSIIDICSKVFFAARDTVTPMINGFVLIGVNILLTMILAPRLGINGLALSTTIAVTIVSVIMFFEMKIKLRLEGFKEIIIVLIKSIISSVIMAFIVYFFYNYLNSIISDGKLMLSIKIVVSTFLGIVIYIFLMKAFKVKEINKIVSLRKDKQ